MELFESREKLQCLKKQDPLYEAKQLYFEPRLHTLKLQFCCFFSNIQRSMAWGFQMNYCSSPQLKGLQSCDLSKLEDKKFKLWAKKVCNKSFSSNLYLKIHDESVHKGQKQKCAIKILENSLSRSQMVCREILFLKP